MVRPEWPGIFASPRSADAVVTGSQDLSALWQRLEDRLAGLAGAGRFEAIARAGLRKYFDAFPPSSNNHAWKARRTMKRTHRAALAVVGAAAALTVSACSASNGGTTSRSHGTDGAPDLKATQLAHGASWPEKTPSSGLAKGLKAANLVRAYFTAEKSFEDTAISERQAELDTAKGKNDAVVQKAEG